jgi:hypothetical protein
MERRCPKYDLATGGDSVRNSTLFSRGCSRDWGGRARKVNEFVLGEEGKKRKKKAE